MSDKQDTLDAVLSVPDAVQDAVDQLNDYLHLFEDDEKLHELLAELLPLLEEVQILGVLIEQRIRAAKTSTIEVPGP